jgi:Holliday junction resolvasome RuvABC endonuclease subunit
MACGAVLTGLHYRLVSAFDFPVAIHTVAVSEWKKAVVGNGNAAKELVLTHSRSLGYNGERQDEADALCIAALGCQLLDRPQPSRVRHPPAHEAA